MAKKSITSKRSQKEIGQVLGEMSKAKKPKTQDEFITFTADVAQGKYTDELDTLSKEQPKISLGEAFQLLKSRGQLKKTGEQIVSPYALYSKIGQAWTLKGFISTSAELEEASRLATKSPKEYHVTFRGIELSPNKHNFGVISGIFTEWDKLDLSFRKGIAETAGLPGKVGPKAWSSISTDDRKRIADVVMSMAVKRIDHDEELAELTASNKLQWLSDRGLIDTPSYARYKSRIESGDTSVLKTVDEIYAENKAEMDALEKAQRTPPKLPGFTPSRDYEGEWDASDRKERRKLAQEAGVRHPYKVADKAWTDIKPKVQEQIRPLLSASEDEAEEEEPVTRPAGKVSKKAVGKSEAFVGVSPKAWDIMDESEKRNSLRLAGAFPGLLHKKWKDLPQKAKDKLSSRQSDLGIITEAILGPPKKKSTVEKAVKVTEDAAEDMWNNLPHKDKQNVLKDVGHSTKLADRDWDRLPKSVRSEIEIKLLEVVQVVGPKGKTTLKAKKMWEDMDKHSRALALRDAGQFAGRAKLEWEELPTKVIDALLTVLKP